MHAPGEGETVGEARAPAASLLALHGLPPAEIEARSLAYVEQMLGCRLPREAAARAVAARMVYAAGDLGLIEALRIHPAAPAAAVAALRAGAPAIVDVQMVAAAVASGPLAQLGCPVHVAVAAAGAADRARSAGTTRTAAGIALLADIWAGGVIAIGTAPTALLQLLDLLAAGAPPPAAIVGTPVGFVAAAEASDELARQAVPFITVLGTRGGAALAGAALNALARLALSDAALPHAHGPAVQ